MMWLLVRALLPALSQPPSHYGIPMCTMSGSTLAHASPPKDNDPSTSGPPPGDLLCPSSLLSSKDRRIAGQRFHMRALAGYTQFTTVVNY